MGQRMASQQALGSGSIGAKEHHAGAWPRIARDDPNPALLQCGREIQSSKPIFSVRGPGDREPVWQRHRPFHVHLARLGNQAKIRLGG